MRQLTMVPLGRSLGSLTGDLKAAASGYLTSLTPQPDGSIKTNSVGVVVLGPEDILNLSCKTTATPISRSAGGNSQSLYGLHCGWVAGGTGNFVGATGFVKVTGTLFSAFGPAAGPGSSHFDGTYTGKICRSK